MRLRTATFGTVLLLSLAACGGGSGGENAGDAVPTTSSPLGTTTFRTIPASTTSVSPDQAVAPDPAIGAGELLYEVQAGDYPGIIDKRYGCKWQEVAAYNDIQPDNFKLYPGDSYKLPPACSGAPAPEVTSANPPAGSTAETPTATEAPAAGGSEYEVEAGDTIYGIASKFGTTPSKLVAANGWSDGIDHLIVPGQKIKLPAPEAG
jgi:LysM repeat protein